MGLAFREYGPGWDTHSIVVFKNRDPDLSLVPRLRPYGISLYVGRGASRLSVCPEWHLEGILLGMARYDGARGFRFLFGVVIYPRSQGYFLHPLFCVKIKCCTGQLNPPPKIVTHLCIVKVCYRESRCLVSRSQEARIIQN